MERKLIKIAVDALRKNTGFNIEVNFTGMVFEGVEYADDQLLEIQIGNVRIEYRVEVKPTINKMIANMLGETKYNQPNIKHLLVTKFVNPALAERLKENDIHFIDTAGNAYIRQLPVLIYLKGNKDKGPNIKLRGENPFTKAGLKLIYALLRNNHLPEQPHRMIAKDAKVALGTVVNIMNALENQGYLIPMGTLGKKLVKQKKLLKQWCLEYPQKLKHQMLLGRFEGPEDFWKNALLDAEHAQWGGEVAAFRLDKYLKPGEVTIYTDKEYLGEIVFQNRLRKANDGNILIFKRFWTEQRLFEQRDIVHPILIYADLLAVDDQRATEAARRIYDRHILRNLRQD